MDPKDPRSSGENIQRPPDDFAEGLENNYFLLDFLDGCISRETNRTS